jgi:exodeoxyribonuclease-3
MRLATWNVNGIRAREDEFLAWIAGAQPDVVCLQEIKAAPDQLSLLLGSIAGYTSFWHGAKGGYSGVSLHVKEASFPGTPLVFTHPDFDVESRVVTVDLGAFEIASMYLPNGGKDYPAKIDFLNRMKAWVITKVAAGKPLVICGDLNIALADADVHPSQRRANAIGQRPEERDLLSSILAAGLVDVGRQLSPDDERMFTWWPYWRQSKERNLGWRLDYFLASPAIAKGAKTQTIERMYGTSDHAPVTLEFEL